MHLLADPSVTVHVMIHVQLLLVAEWCIFILKRISVHILALSVVQKNGITLTKIRTTVERDINHIKDNLCLAGRRTQNEKNTSRRSGGNYPTDNRLYFRIKSIITNLFAA